MDHLRADPVGTLRAAGLAAAEIAVVLAAEGLCQDEVAGYVDGVLGGGGAFNGLGGPAIAGMSASASAVSESSWFGFRVPW
jgi:hypothetical protein